jgi:catechol 2,3-dioxygenase-like lactoylglutathione lyase family enzyme
VHAHHVSVFAVPVSDPARAKAFYTDVLGFEIVHESDFGSGLRWTTLRPPGRETAITLTTWFESMPPGSLSGTVLSVPDIEEAASELRAHGVLEEDDLIEQAPWGRFVTIEDPDGNSWVIQQDDPSFTGLEM